MAEQKKEKVTTPATEDEALENAGTTVLSHLTSRAHKLNQQEVEEIREGLEPPDQPQAYSGPYTDPNDERNSWTYEQEQAAAGGGKSERRKTDEQRKEEQQKKEEQRKEEQRKEEQRREGQTHEQLRREHPEPHRGTK